MKGREEGCWSESRSKKQDHNSEGMEIPAASGAQDRESVLMMHKIKTGDGKDEVRRAL